MHVLLRNIHLLQKLTLAGQHSLLYGTFVALTCMAVVLHANYFATVVYSTATFMASSVIGDHDESRFYEPDGSMKKPATLPARLADAVRKVEYYDDGSVKHIELHDKVRALQIVMKHLGGLQDGTPAGAHNTLNVAITDEQRVAALMSLLARARGATTDCDSTQDPAEQSPALVQKTKRALPML
jgi:hypothetical protein